MRGWAIVFASVCSAAIAAAEPSPVPLQLEVTKNGESLQVAFDAFLAKVIAHFDADGDGQLSVREVERVFPFPLATGKFAALQLATADTSADGQVDLKELQAWCAKAQITPLTQATAAATADDQRLATIFVTALDADGNGKIKPKEWQTAARRLQQFDLNDDETLELKELLSGSRVSVDLKRTAKDEPIRYKLRLNLGDVPSASLEIENEKQSLPIEIQRFHYANNTKSVILSGRLSRELPNIANVAEFLVAQLEGASSGGGLKKSAVMSDESLAGLRDLFDYADRNQDGLLMAAELRSYCELIAEGLAVRYYVVLQDRGGNWFSFLDIDGDQRLSAKELTQLRSLPRTESGELARLQELEFRPLPINAWGGVPIPPLARKKAVPAKPKATSPAWFVSQDRNGDFYLSRREFLGPVALFESLDANDDDLIDAAEAAAK
ncbi:EF-hand domain-containing protein [Anatilimnocola floriformis]|uniref:EF-hand domain-containing protein n=1 Tax=Anatilimnocola floriformis TaxID=2948575 RepID=UPI0020C42AB2|nr:EF-hand domain-containing protein [Anatilimnocola floriformis]